MSLADFSLLGVSDYQQTGARADTIQNRILDHWVRTGVFQPQVATPSLPTDPAERKGVQLWSGLKEYFPDALIYIALISAAGNKQHNLGGKLHWDRSKSTDQEDALMRHLWERGTMDTDGFRHSGKVGWRALAMLQLELEEAKKNV